MYIYTPLFLHHFYSLSSVFLPTLLESLTLSPSSEYYPTLAEAIISLANQGQPEVCKTIMANGRIKRLWETAKVGKDVVSYVLWLGTFIGWSAIMLYLGSITAWAAPIGPMGWLIIAVLTFTIGSGGYAWFSYGRSQRIMAKFSDKKAAAGSVNVLAPLHQHERINAADFYHPFFRPTKNARFEECELMGPASVFINGGTLDSCGFYECEAVIVRDDRPIKGVTAFFNCVFLRCSMYRLTLFMNYQQYLTMPPEFRTGVTVISDGRIGDV